MHVERLFQIVFLLMSGSCGTAKELAEHCSVSVRTIQRDLDALSLAGIPIFSNRGRGGRHRTAQGIHAGQDIHDRAGAG